MTGRMRAKVAPPPASLTEERQPEPESVPVNAACLDLPHDLLP